MENLIDGDIEKSSSNKPDSACDNDSNDETESDDENHNDEFKGTLMQI